MIFFLIDLIASALPPLGILAKGWGGPGSGSGGLGIQVSIHVRMYVLFSTFIPTPFTPSTVKTKYTPSPTPINNNVQMFEPF